MDLRASWAFLVVGGALTFFGLLLLLLAAAPANGMVLLVLGVLHLTVGLVLRGRERRRAT